jgi:hypothetical protein
MMLDLLEKFYGARAHHTYGKRETNAGPEVVGGSNIRILLIIKTITRFDRLSSDMLLPKNGQNTLELTFFVHSEKHK